MLVEIAGGRGDGGVVAAYFDGDDKFVGCGRGCRDVDRVGVDVGCDSKRFDVGGTDRLKPDGLPDTGYGGVEDSEGFVHLFAAGLWACVGGVPDGECNLLGSVFVEGLCDVEAEGVVAAPVHADLLVVDPDFSFVVYGTEMEQDIPAFPVRGDIKCASIPEALPGRDMLGDTREVRLNGERHEYLVVEVAGVCVVLVGDAVLPDPVEVHPVVSDHLGAWVFGKDVLRGDVLGPSCEQWSVGAGRPV